MTNLTRLGFYITLLGVVGQAVVSATAMPYFTAKLIEKGLMLCLIAGFAFSLLAIISGSSGSVGWLKRSTTC